MTYLIMGVNLSYDVKTGNSSGAVILLPVKVGEQGTPNGVMINLPVERDLAERTAGLVGRQVEIDIFARLAHPSEPSPDAEIARSVIGMDRDNGRVGGASAAGQGKSSAV